MLLIASSPEGGALGITVRLHCKIKYQNKMR